MSESSLPIPEGDVDAELGLDPDLPEDFDVEALGDDPDEEADK